MLYFIEDTLKCNWCFVYFLACKCAVVKKTMTAGTMSATALTQAKVPAGLPTIVPVPSVQMSAQERRQRNS